MDRGFADIVWPGWEVVDKLGEGSFGGVYEIQRTLPDGTVERAALKKLTVPRDREELDVLRAQSFSMARITAYFKQQMEELVNEYLFMQELGGCPNVVSCQDIRYFQHNDGIGWDIYIRMELLKPLKKVVAKKYSEYQVLRLGMDICRALLACESVNIIHRDIKPENILVSENGRYKLGDFGIAKVSEKTQTGTLAGTNGYMAPEVANLQQYGTEVDIYSLGLVLYWMMNNNTLPFLPPPPTISSAEQRQEAITRRLDGEPLPSPRNGSEYLKRVVLKACSYNPEDRFRSAREFGAALQHIFRNLKATDTDSILQEIGITKEMLTGEPGSTIRGTSNGRTNSESETIATSSGSKDSPKKKKRWIWMLVGVIALVLIMAIGFFSVMITRPKDKWETHMQEDVFDSGAMIESEPLVAQTEETTECILFPYIYDQYEGGVRITGWNEETPAEAVLPSEIDGLPLVEIGSEAFSGCTHLTSVVIPESVTMIGERAFSGCSSLTRIDLPQGLKALEKGVFSDCIALNQISVPESVVAIEESAFENCKELSAITLSPGIITLGNRAFFACSQINDVTLPDTLEQIGEGAFQNCESLSGIDIPESVTQIGDAAFFHSLMLTATVPVSYKDELRRFMPESCEVTYSGIEKPNVYGEIGDIITFGSYEQDNDLTNGKEPIEWQILEKDGSRIYVISKYGLDSQRYHDKWEVVCWETCKLRVWLNQTFYAEAFNPAEQGMIVTTDVRSVHPSGSYPSKTVQDKVFLLDFDGSYRYFKGEKARTCIATAYAKAQGSTTENGDRCWWWLREGYFVDLASIPNAWRVSLTNFGGTVRPMICIDTAT